MLRLVKVLNGNTQCDVVRLKYNLGVNLGPGSAMSSSGGYFTALLNTDTPEFVALSTTEIPFQRMDAITVTEDMIFKVEYTGTATPYVGMKVGLSSGLYKMDSVTYNANGKGIVVGVDDNPGLVYVRFHR